MRLDGARKKFLIYPTLSSSGTLSHPLRLTLEARVSGTKRDLVIVPPPQRCSYLLVEELRIIPRENKMTLLGSAVVEGAEAPAHSDGTYLLHDLFLSQYNV